nr:hypothetical protein [uncultured Acetatifactor sp.]
MRWRAGQDAAWEGGIERENPLKADKRRRGGGAKEKTKGRRRKGASEGEEAQRRKRRRGGGIEEKVTQGRKRHRDVAGQRAA